jgi:UDP-3-O-[3-hydroxymyristoyl] glucosamine N-acyltransferase
MKFSAAQIAGLLNGEVDGNPEVTVSNLSKIEEGIPGTLSFLANPKYAPHIYHTRASIVIVAKSFVAERALPESLTLIKVDDPKRSFAQLLEIYSQLKQPKAEISPLAFIHPNAEIGHDCYIGSFVHIGNGSRIGEGVILHPGVFIGDGVSVGNKTVLHAGVKVYSDCIIGAQCTIHGGTVIGGDGFGFTPNQDNQYAKVPHIGNVVIHDYVEIGANTAIDRATMGSTVIRKGVKLDNLIQIAHNVDIGENTVIAAQTGIAGSTKIGKNCMIGGQVGIVGHLQIADGTKIAAQSGIGHDILEPDTVVQGSPAFSIMDYKKSYVGFRKLPDILSRLADLEKRTGMNGN